MNLIPKEKCSTKFLTAQEQGGQGIIQTSGQNLFMKQNQFSALSEPELPLLKGGPQYIGNDDAVLISRGKNDSDALPQQRNLYGHDVRKGQTGVLQLNNNEKRMESCLISILSSFALLSFWQLGNVETIIESTEVSYLQALVVIRQVMNFFFKLMLTLL